MVSILWFIQTKNLLLARTTYERFSNSANLAYSNVYGEVVSPSSDTLSLNNCIFMCFKHEIPMQEKLREARIKDNIEATRSMLSNGSSLEIEKEYYGEMAFDKECGAFDIKMDEY